MTMAETETAPAADVGAVTDLLHTTSRLIGVLEREIDMLREMQPSAMQALQEEKIVLAAAYESQLKRLAANPEVTDAMAPEMRADVRQVTARFQEALTENERALRAAKHATDSLLQAIVEGVDKQQPEVSYAANGQHRTAGANAARSVAIDQRF